MLTKPLIQALGTPDIQQYVGLIEAAVYVIGHSVILDHFGPERTLGVPNRTPRVCNKCRRTVPPGRPCDCTPKPTWQATNSYTSSGSTRRWRKLRESKLQANPMCQWPDCKHLAHEVDHIINVTAGGGRYDWNNLQSLCTPHHRDKTTLEATAGRWPDKPPF